MLDIAEWCKNNVKKSETFLDVVANIGDVSREVSAKLKICVEGNKDIITDGDCIVINKLALDRPGVRMFFHVNYAPSQSTIYGGRFKNGEGERKEDEVTTIDDIL